VYTPGTPSAQSEHITGIRKLVDLWISVYLGLLISLLFELWIFIIFELLISWYLDEAAAELELVALLRE